jgi:hypothetical protein
MRVLLLTASLVAVGVAAIPAQTVRYVDGLFIHTGPDGGPIELIAWAEATSRGQLRMSRGTLEDAPAVDTIARIMCSIPLWRPVGAFVTTTGLFVEERTERRNLAFAVRKLNIYALEVRIADLEDRAKIDALLRAVRASQDTPGYAFIVLSGGDYQRFYPVRLTPAER